MPNKTDKVVVPESRGGSLKESEVEFVTRAFAKGRGFLKDALEATKKYNDNKSQEALKTKSPPPNPSSLDETGDNFEDAGLEPGEEETTNEELDRILQNTEKNYSDANITNLEGNAPSEVPNTSPINQSSQPEVEAQSEEEWLAQFDTDNLNTLNNTSSQTHRGLYTRGSARKSPRDLQSLEPPEKISEADRNSEEWKDKGNKYIRTESGGMKVVRPGDPEYPE